MFVLTNNKGCIIKLVLRDIIIATAALAVLTNLSHALDSSAIPFFGKKNPFVLSIDGNNALRERIEQTITKQRLSNEELRQFTKANKIARLEKQIIIELLHAEGYYDARIRVDLEQEHIHYHIEQGTAYRLADVDLSLPDGILIPPNIVKMKRGDILRAQAVLADKKALQNYVVSHFCLYEVEVDYTATIASKSHLSNLTFTVANSPQVQFGKISFSGTDSIDPVYLKNRIPIQSGDCYKQTLIDSARLALIQTNLLTSAIANIGEPADGEVPVTFKVTERHHRTISLGTGFQTDEGFGVFAGWEHRNFAARAQRLQIHTQVAENVQSFSTDLTIPNFRKKQQSLTLYGAIANEETDAFDSETLNLGGEIARQLHPYLRAAIGSELSFADVVEDGEKENFALLSVMLNFAYDKRNDLIDPRSGWVASAQIRPFWDAYDTRTQFIKSTLASSAYFSFTTLPAQPTLALRAAVGMIDGSDRNEVPANVRFYVGGGGSVRGYPFQSLGPLTDKEPDGGLSFTELSLETRLRFGKNWGAVAFLDGGFAFQELTPRLDEDLLWGAGIGLRYYTSFAPLRLDLALPLDKRDAIDDDFQLYISIGQAF